ncbi:MAG: inositol monophosphatase family protein, partial [Pseudomonadota bacterium]
MAEDFTARIVSFAERLADESRAILNEVAGQIPDVTIKADDSYVTETDKRIETRLREIIDAEFPEHGILGEEHGARDLDAEYVWVLDPIDGTAPFIAGIPVYGTLIGLAHHAKPWLGVIDHPATSDRWVGISGHWATHNGQPVRTRGCTELSSALMTNSNPDFFEPAEREAFDALRTRVHYTQYGASCYAYGVLASGRTDLAID